MELKENIIVDPGIGFGKDFKQNIDILNNLSIFHTLNCSIMLEFQEKIYIFNKQRGHSKDEWVGLFLQQFLP